MISQIGQSTRPHRYELVHDDDADFVAYQRLLGDGAWHTFLTWMIPRLARDDRA